MLVDFPPIVADESVDGRIVLALINAGYNVFPIAPTLAGISDFKVIEIAVEKNAFVITEDKDFGDELVYKKAAQTGSLLLRLGKTSIEEKIQLLLKVLQVNGPHIQEAFSVLTQKKLRIHKY